jgi:hypothetical protein
MAIWYAIIMDLVQRISVAMISTRLLVDRDFYKNEFEVHM